MIFWRIVTDAQFDVKDRTRGTRVNRDASKSDSDKAEDEGVISGTAAKRGRDVASTGHTEQRDGKIAEGGHGLGSGTAADTGSVFIEGDIADPVEAVFNRPMAATQTEQGLRTGMFGFKTGDAVNGFGTGLLRTISVVSRWMAKTWAACGKSI